MDIQTYLNGIADENEKPLQRMVTDGGFCGILRTVGCVGDSLSSGEFEMVDGEGKKHYLDFYDYSWGQFYARMAGCQVRNFSKGGMTAKDYMEQFAEQKGFWASDLACQAYIVALGVNDLVGQKQELGSIEDICRDDWKQNKHTFAGYYAMIVQRLKAIQPDAKFFFMTMPRTPSDSEEVSAVRDAHASLLYEFAGFFSNSYVLDFRKYAPVYDDAFKKRFYLLNHLNASGYLFTAMMVASYIDFIIRHHPDDFREAGFIGTPYKNKNM